MKSVPACPGWLLGALVIPGWLSSAPAAPQGYRQLQGESFSHICVSGKPDAKPARHTHRIYFKTSRNTAVVRVVTTSVRRWVLYHWLLFIEQCRLCIAPRVRSIWSFLAGMRCNVCIENDGTLLEGSWIFV